MASPVDTSVKFFSSAMPGAPVLNGTVGAQIALLDALLVNGFGLKSADSLVISGGVATINIASGHPAVVDSVILVSGTTPAELNGEQRVIAITATSVSFATTLPNQTATGAITFKIAPVGFSKPFAGTNLAVYKQTDPQSSGMYLRVDDTNAKFSRVIGYEMMSDLNTGTGPFPTTVQSSGGLWWVKSQTADASPRSWYCIADSRTIYLFKCVHPSYNYYFNTSSFGDLTSTRAGDPYACFIQGSANDTSNSYQTDDALARSKAASSASGIYLARSYGGLGGAVTVVKMCPAFNVTSDFHSGDTPQGSTPYPNLTDGGLYVSPFFISESVNAVFRGTMRGIWGCPQRVPAGNFAAGDTVSGVSGLPGKKLRAMTGSPNATGGGVYFIDVTGPWG